MTEQPEKTGDRELEQYLAGGSTLSKRYRDASTETAPAELDELVLVRARAEARRKPSLNKLLTPLAAAATVVVAVNVGWQVYKTEPVPPELQAERDVSGARARALSGAPPRETAPAAKAAPLEEKLAAPAAADEPELEKIEVTGTRRTEAEQAEHAAELARQEQQQRAKEERARVAEQIEAQRRAMKTPDEAGSAAPVAPAVDAAPPAAFAPSAAEADDVRAPPPTDAQKIDKLIAYIGRLEGAVFIRNGKEYGPADAAKHLQYKRTRAGDRVKTPDDFIRLCASHSSQSGEAYLIRFADGRTSTAEDVLRDELARLEGLR